MSIKRYKPSKKIQAQNNKAGNAHSKLLAFLNLFRIKKGSFLVGIKACYAKTKEIPPIDLQKSVGGDLLQITICQMTLGLPEWLQVII